MSLSIVSYLATAPPEPDVRGRHAGSGASALPDRARAPAEALRPEVLSSYAAATFPFVITATAFRQPSRSSTPEARDCRARWTSAAETAIAAVMIAYVFRHYALLRAPPRLPQSEPVVRENRMTAHFAEHFEN
ncbi:MAG: hypothetical protein ACLSVD_09490 [Eggerthellaceae bacterium]